MGGCNSTPEEREQRRVNNQINKQLSKEKRNQSVKILLLGTGVSTMARVNKTNLDLRGLPLRKTND